MTAPEETQDASTRRTNHYDAAFNPQVFYNTTQDKYDRPYSQCLGLTKREYFAGMAMSGIAVWDAKANSPSHSGIERLARACVAYADALIAELNKEKS